MARSNDQEEQLRGEVATELSDQFSLCVTMWEALFGERPFAAKSLTALTEAVQAGRIRAPSATRGVPRWLRRALRTGPEVSSRRSVA